MCKNVGLLLCGVFFVVALFTSSAFTSKIPTTHAASLAPAYTCPLPVIHIGDSGPVVKLAQQSLNYYYSHTNFGNYPSSYMLAEDGQFGSQTRAVVLAFQKWDTGARLVHDGVVGPKTWYALGHC